MLVELSKILAQKRGFMFSFMENYICRKIGVNRREILDSRDQFKKIIKFCLMTAQRTNSQVVNNGVQYFNNRYDKFRDAIYSSDWNTLVNITYNSPGAKQKIGGLILEVFIHYGEFNHNLENELYVPIDTHVKRIFSECLGETGVSNNGLPNITRESQYHHFQQRLKENTFNSLPRIYFDYLWFVGKVFCTQKLDNVNNPHNRSYRLCSICWLKDICICIDRWEYLQS